jgi:hypothetical protein
MCLSVCAAAAGAGSAVPWSSPRAVPACEPRLWAPAATRPASCPQGPPGPAAGLVGRPPPAVPAGPLAACGGHGRPRPRARQDPPPPPLSWGMTTAHGARARPQPHRHQGARAGGTAGTLELQGPSGPATHQAVRSPCRQGGLPGDARGGQTFDPLSDRGGLCITGRSLGAGPPAASEAGRSRASCKHWHPCSRPGIAGWLLRSSEGQCSSSRQPSLRPVALTWRRGAASASRIQVVALAAGVQLGAAPLLQTPCMQLFSRSPPRECSRVAEPAQGVFAEPPRGGGACVDVGFVCVSEKLRPLAPSGMPCGSKWQPTNCCN